MGDFLRAVSYMLAVFVVLLNISTISAQVIVLHEAQPTIILQSKMEKVTPSEIKKFAFEEYNPEAEKGKIPRWITDMIERKMVAFIKMDDGSTLIMKIVTDERYKVTEIDTIEKDKITEFNPAAEIYTDERTVKNVINSGNREVALKYAIVEGKITIKGHDIGSQIRYGFANFFGRISAKFMSSPFDVKRGEIKDILCQGKKAILKRNILGHLVIYRERLPPLIINRMGVVTGYTTPGIQKLIEANPEGLSQGAGIISETFPEDVAQMFLEKVEVSKDSIVYFAPVKPGTVIREGVSESPVELEVPEEPETYYMFLVDEMPGYKFAHPMQYTLMDVKTGNIETLDASWWPTIIEDNDIVSIMPNVFLNFGNVKFIKSDVKERESIDVSDKPEAKPPVETPSGAQPEPRKCPGNRYALVIDMGDKNKWGHIADLMAEDADKIAKWLEKNGFQVYRISQYWGNYHAKIMGKNATEVKENFGLILQTYAKKLKCCDNFFLYITAHGNKQAIVIYDSMGKDFDAILDFDLKTWLDEFPSCVNITIFIDSCHSGSFIPELSKLREGHSKVVILTACEENETTPSGSLLGGPSATDDFMKGASKDKDGDKKKGDINDCYKEMEEWAGEDRNPQLSRDSRYKTLCILD